MSYCKFLSAYECTYVCVMYLCMNTSCKYTCKFANYANVFTFFMCIQVRNFIWFVGVCMFEYMCNRFLFFIW